MTREEIRNYVIQRYQEGQTIILWLKSPEDERVHIQTHVKIVKFYEGHVAAEVRGRMSSVSYLEMIQLIKKPGKENKISIDVSGLIARQQGTKTYFSCYKQYVKVGRKAYER